MYLIFLMKAGHISTVVNFSVGDMKAMLVTNFSMYSFSRSDAGGLPLPLGEVASDVGAVVVSGLELRFNFESCEVSSRNDRMNSSGSTCDS